MGSGLWGVEEIVGTVPVIENGRYTGATLPPTCQGPASRPCSRLTWVAQTRPCGSRAAPTATASPTWICCSASDTRSPCIPMRSSLRTRAAKVWEILSQDEHFSA